MTIIFRKAHVLTIAGLAALVPLVAATAVVAQEALRHGHGDIAGLAAKAPGPHAEALVDGFVSVEEYESAVGATVECLRAAGIQVTEPAWTDQELRFTYGGYATRAEIESAGEVYSGCHAANQAAIDRVWARQQMGERPSDEAVANYHSLMQACTGATEPTFRAIVTAAEASGDPSLLERCHVSAAEETGIPAR